MSRYAPISFASQYSRKKPKVKKTKKIKKSYGKNKIRYK